MVASGAVLADVVIIIIIVVVITAFVVIATSPYKVIWLALCLCN